MSHTLSKSIPTAGKKTALHPLSHFIIHTVHELLRLVTCLSCSTRRDAKVVAPTVYGAYHALQTLSQLITFDFDTKRYSVPFAPWFVTDAPRFSHREVLVDTARHWQPLPKLVSLNPPDLLDQLFAAHVCSSPTSAARDYRQSHPSKIERAALAHCGFPILSF
jgi:hypothetical protein